MCIRDRFIIAYEGFECFEGPPGTVGPTRPMASLTLDDSRVYKRWVDQGEINFEWKWTWKKSWHWQQDEQDPTLMRKREKYCHPSCTHCPTEFMWGDWGDVVKSALDKNAEEYRKPYIPPNPTASAASSSASCGAGVPAAQAG